MIDWTLPADLQEQFERVLAQNKRLQLELGIKSRTLEERAADYARRKQEEAELAKFLGKKRPPLRYKV